MPIDERDSFSHRSTRRREAVILVRIDDMASYTTDGQRSIRFELDADVPDDVSAAAAAALKAAPPIDQWQGF